jgi:hypothetical protein
MSIPLILKARYPFPLKTLHPPQKKRVQTHWRPIPRPAVNIINQFNRLDTQFRQPWIGREN